MKDLSFGNNKYLCRPRLQLFTIKMASYIKKIIDGARLHITNRYNEMVSKYIKGGWLSKGTSNINHYRNWRMLRFSPSLRNSIAWRTAVTRLMHKLKWHYNPSWKNHKSKQLWAYDLPQKFYNANNKNNNIRNKSTTKKNYNSTILFNSLLKLFLLLNLVIWP